MTFRSSRRRALPIFAKDEVFYVGEPILAVAAENELIAANALEAIKIDFRAAAPCGRSRSRACFRAVRTHVRRQCRGRPDQAADREMGRLRFRRRRRIQAADGTRGGRMDLWRCRWRLQERQGDDRGELRLGHLFAQLHGDHAPPSPTGRAASASCMAPTRAIPPPSPTSPAISASSRRTWSSSPNIAAADSAARFRAIRTWRSPR